MESPAGQDLGQVGAVGGTGVLVAQEGYLAVPRSGCGGACVGVGSDLGCCRCQGVWGWGCAFEEGFRLPGAVGAGGDSRDRYLGPRDESVSQADDRANTR